VKKILVAAVAVIAAVAVAGCGAESRDLEGVPFKKPDKIETYINIDTHPNITRLCIAGVAFATTSREYTSVFRVPEWDAWCNQ